ncbi:hypothetical protein Q4519_21955, partial [Motilimonas sp. 1_MG-2023]|uniref:hypothetical protein n=1 Tax=Motilimonas sp. 1_MG-2023 TaxID=3062672 RepID=UPI0026E3F1AC
SSEIYKQKLTQLQQREQSTPESHQITVVSDYTLPYNPTPRSESPRKQSLTNITAKTTHF